MKISYFNKRDILMGRIRLNGTVTDRSTGIKMTGELFDYKAKRFRPKSPNAITLNKALAEFETQVYGRVVRPTLDGDVTLKTVCDEYEWLLDSGAITSAKTGMRVSDATVSNLKTAIRIIRRSKVEFNFTAIGPNHPQARTHYSNLVVELKALLNGEQSSASTILSRFRLIIVHVCTRHSIMIEHLLKDMRIRVLDKKVMVISHEQIQFVIDNYESIKSECSPVQAMWLDYWVTALLLNPRIEDMTSFDAGNLYQKGGLTWIKYIPHKTKNSSSIQVDVPVHPMLVDIFNRNLLQYKKLLPPVSQVMASRNIKEIARRYEIFQGEVQVLKRGKFVNVPQWQTLTMHQMRGSGMSDKLGAGMPEAIVRAYSGHTVNSASFRRYINIGNDSKEKFALEYFSGMAKRVDEATGS